MQEYDPDFHEDFHDIDTEQGVFDTYDQIINEDDLIAEQTDQQEDVGLSSEQLGLAFALAEELSKDTVDDRDIDENTDEENFRRAMLQNPPAGNETELRPFEQIIDDICKGRRSLFDLNF